MLDAKEAEIMYFQQSPAGLAIVKQDSSCFPLPHRPLLTAKELFPPGGSLLYPCSKELDKFPYFDCGTRNHKFWHTLSPGSKTPLWLSFNIGCSQFNSCWSLVLTWQHWEVIEHWRDNSVMRLCFRVVCFPSEPGICCESCHQKQAVIWLPFIHRLPPQPTH